MGYKMEYGSWNKQPIYRRMRAGNRILIGVLVSLVLAVGIWQRERMISFFIPGEPEITKQAASVFVDALQAGGSIKEAFTSFCKVILDDAGIY